jgi:hypothetical protein
MNATLPNATNSQSVEATETSTVSRATDTSETNSFQEVVTFGNYQPNNITLEVLNIYNDMWNGKPYKGYSLSSWGGGIYADLLWPDDDKWAVSNIFTEDMDDNVDIVNEYNGEFQGERCNGMVDEEYCCVCFVHLSVEDGKTIRNVYQLVSPRLEGDKRLPPCFIKALEIYYQLHNTHPVDRAFIFGAMMLSASTQQDETYSGEDELLIDWFIEGTATYLSYLAENSINDGGVK